MMCRLLTWNLERKRADKPRGTEALDHVFGLEPDVMVLTEARTSMPQRGGHSIWCEPPVGTHFGDDERKVLMWSKEPWTAVDRIGIDALDDTRFISASTLTPIGELRVIGICIPWHMAEVTSPSGEKHKPWELHLRYLELFEPIEVITTGHIDGTKGPGIDHIAISAELRATRVWGWPNDVNGNRLSDHDGAACELAIR